MISVHLIVFKKRGNVYYPPPWISPLTPTRPFKAFEERASLAAGQCKPCWEPGRSRGSGSELESPGPWAITATKWQPEDLRAKQTGVA
jgi:hypothetical protein